MATNNYKGTVQQQAPQEKRILRPEDFPVAKLTAKKFNFDDTTFRLLLASVVPDTARDHEVAALIYQSARTGLDAMARQIYLVPRKGGCAVQTGIDGYRLIADRTGKYAGGDDPVYDEGLTQYQWIQAGRERPETATVSIYKMVDGQMGKYTATAAWAAYFPGEIQGYMWKKMPLLMLAKCAEALALRKAFPAQLSGIYTDAEMMQAGDSVDTATLNEITSALGFQSPNAVQVADKLEDVGIDPVDERVTAFLGMPITELPDSPESNDLLKVVWGIAADIKRGVAVDVAMQKIEAK